MNNLAAAFALAGLLAAPGYGRSRKGEKLIKDGRLAEAKRDFDKALELFEQAVGDDPQDASYQLAVKRVRFQAGQKHVEDGLKLREEGKLEEAAAQFQKAFATDPSSSIAMNELKRTMAMIEAAKKKASPDNKDDNNEAASPQQQLQERMASMQSAPVLKPMNARITTLKMNNQPVRVLFETLSKLGGVNVIWDPEYQSSGKNYSVDLSNITMDQALDQLSVLTKTFWKPISSNTIFLTNDNVTKRRDHEEMVVKTFYLRNLTTPQELQEIATILRSVTDIRRVFTYNSQNVIMVRGEVDKVALAEKLVADLDKPKGEVVIDVYVMEANRNRTRDLAATFISGGTNGLKLPISFLGGTKIGNGGTSTDTGGTTGIGGTAGTTSGTSSSGVLRLTELGRIKAGDFAMAIPNGLLQALMTDSGTRLMQTPQLRATHGIKSTIKIGDRYPYATGSFQPGIGMGGAGMSPLVSTQFQFADVGVNVDITPIIHGAEEVTMQVDVDISNIRDKVDVGGLSQPVIGQRKFAHNIRLRTGEVSLLGGLTQDQDTRSLSGTPGLAHLPIIGRLFSGENVSRTQGELMIALVPHIVRVADISDLNTRGVAAGTDTVVRLNYDSKPEPAGPPAAETPKPVEPPEIAPPPPPPPASAAPGGPPKLSFNPGAANVKLGAAATVTLQVENVEDLAGAPLRIKWDPKILRLNEANKGTIFDAGGETPIYTRNIRNDEGEVTVNLSRKPGGAAAKGSGSLVTLVFQAAGKGSTAVSVAEANLRDSKMQPIKVDSPAVTVNVE